MKILVFVKQVPDTDDVKLDPKTGNIMREGVASKLNPLDANAVEAAIQLKEKYGAQVCAISMGPPQAEDVLKKAGLEATFMETEKAAAVQRQSPTPGNLVVKGSPVILYTAWTTFQGEEEEIEMVEVPKLMGKNRLNAMDALTKAGLVMDYDRSKSTGTVIQIQYPEGTKIPKGSTVYVEFSGGKDEE